MVRRINPYRPGAGRTPPLLAGREQPRADFERLLDTVTATGQGDRSWIMSGLRGVGKTVLLNDYVATAGDKAWLTVKVEATRTQSLAATLTKALYVPLRKLTTQGGRVSAAWSKAVAVFSAFHLTVDPTGTYSFGVDIKPAAGTADTGELSLDLTELLRALGETAREEGTGVLVAVDELQEAPDSDLHAVNQAMHALGQERDPVPVLLVGAGLPSLPATLAEATSYAERLYEYRTLGLLDTGAARLALTVPADAAGVEWDAEALKLAVNTARGYPYFVQACGKHMWDMGDTATITLDDAVAGVTRARAEVDDGLYRSRWERATPAQRQLLRAMAERGKANVSMSDLVSAMNKRKASDLSGPRDELIRKGLIYAPERGYIAFTAPGMDDFIRNQP